ncbi:MAG: dihydroneopterin aldolase [Deltaproteobacteria bacterium]|nr:dihydroneopterin aldolase [Deltaproteobacteria bacterium]
MTKPVMETVSVPDRVFVEGVEFLGRHGVSGRERKVGHRCRADVVLELDTRLACRTDDVKHTADYSTLAEIITTLGTRRSFKLLETLADHIARRILKETPALRVTVTVRKLGVAVPGIPAAVGVTITRGRG